MLSFLPIVDLCYRPNLSCSSFVTYQHSLLQLGALRMGWITVPRILCYHGCWLAGNYCSCGASTFGGHQIVGSCLKTWYKLIGLNRSIRTTRVDFLMVFWLWVSKFYPTQIFLSSPTFQFRHTHVYSHTFTVQLYNESRHFSHKCSTHSW